MPQRYFLGIDQGSSGSRAMLIDAEGQVHGYGYQAVDRLYPHPGWVEQAPQAIAESVRAAVGVALAQGRLCGWQGCGLRHHVAA